MENLFLSPFLQGLIVGALLGLLPRIIWGLGACFRFRRTSLPRRWRNPRPNRWIPEKKWPEKTATAPFS